MSLVAFCVAGAVLSEMGGFRFHRTEAAVDLARHIAACPDVEGAVVRDLWKAGGRIYLSRVPLHLPFRSFPVQTTRLTKQ